MLDVKIESGFKDEIMLFIDPEKIDYTSDLFITELGYYPNAEHHYRQRKEGSEQYIYIKCLKGIGFIQLGKSVHKIEQNRIAIIPKHTPHKYWADEENPWSIQWVHFDGINILNHYSSIKEFSVQKLYRNQSTTITSAFAALIDYMNISMNANVIEYAKSTMKYILASTFVGVSFSKMEKENQVEKAIVFMKSNIFSNLKLSDIAEECNISKSQLSLLFSRERGTSPINFFLSMKIDLAVKYLLLTDMSIKEISYRLGFKDQYYFSRLFKNVKGISPLQYKKENKMI